MSKSVYRDKLCFMSFAVFFIFIAFFLGEIRIRYILPVIPVLSILTVMGLINIWNWTMSHSNRFGKVLAVLVFSFFIVMMSKNIFYIKNYYQTISPMNYVLGKESRDEFITRHNSSYPAIKYINTHTPENARVRLIFLAQRGYYLDRIYQDDPLWEWMKFAALQRRPTTIKFFKTTFIPLVILTYLSELICFINFYKIIIPPIRENC